MKEKEEINTEKGRALRAKLMDICSDAIMDGASPTEVTEALETTRGCVLFLTYRVMTEAANGEG